MLGGRRRAGRPSLDRTDFRGARSASCIRPWLEEQEVKKLPAREDHGRTTTFWIPTKSSASPPPPSSSRQSAIASRILSMTSSRDFP